MKEIFSLIWSYGPVGMGVFLCYTILGLIVYWNVCWKAEGHKLKFWRFTIFSVICGPIAWFCYIFYFIFKCCNLVDIKSIAAWLTNKEIDGYGSFVDKK